MGALADSYAILRRGTLWSSTGRCKGFAVANPGEAAKIDAYVAALDTWLPGAAPPARPVLATDTGNGIVGMLAAAASKQPAPAPTPVPAPAPTPTPGPSPAPSVLPKQGLNVGYVVLAGTSARQDQTLDAAKDLANGKPCWVRMDWWPDSISQGRFDTMAAKCVTRGLTPMGLYNEDYSKRTAMETYAANCATLATKCSLVNTFNEPDMSGWPPELAADYSAAAYAAVKAANPNAVVVGPSSWKTQTQNVRDGFNWIVAFLTHLGGRKALDILDLHLYDRAGQVDPNWNFWDWVFRNGGNNVVAAMATLGYGDVPIMCTEAGSRVSSNGETYQQQAVAEGMDSRTAVPQTSLKIVSYGVYAIPDDASPGGFGLKRSDWSSRPAYAEFKSRAA